MIAPRKGRKEAAKEFSGWNSNLNEAMHALKVEEFTDKRKKYKVKNLLKKYVTIKKDHYAKRANLEKLKGAGRNIRSMLEHGEDSRESFFGFREPVEGCIYDLGKAKRNITIPMEQEDMSEFLEFIQKHTYSVIEQLLNQVEHSLGFYVIANCDMSKFDSDGHEVIQERTEKSKYYKVYARNNIAGICEAVHQDISAKFMIPQKVG